MSSTMQGRGARARRLERSTLSAIFAVLLAVAGSGAAHGQVLVVTERDLTFGLVTPGVPVAVAPTDVMHSAQLRMEGQGRMQVSFQLPGALMSGGGHMIPLVFGAADAMLTVVPRGSRTFNPHQTMSFQLTPALNEAQINLGGRALPAPGQPAGRYSATIVMIVVQTGT